MRHNEPMVITPTRMPTAEKVLIAVALAITIPITIWPAVDVTTGVLSWPIAVATQWAAIALIVVCRRPLSAVTGWWLSRSRS